MRIVSVLLVVSGLAAVSLLAGRGPSASGQGMSRSLVRCGVERWAVKTLQDRPALLAARAVGIEYLVTRQPPAQIGERRLPFERRVFSVVAAVTLIRSEDDGDLHLVLRAGGQQMIAEAPSSFCTAGAKPVFRRAMALARSRVRLCQRARLIGVAFFDFDHGQTGVAPNAIELHPLLGFHCLA